MAIDTRDKRASVLGVGLVALLVLPAPGSLDQPDRQQLAYTYRGPFGSTSYTLSASAGAYTLTGTAVTLRWAHKVTAASGSYVWTGTSAGLKLGRKVGAGSGAYVWTGTDATLFKTGSYSLSVQSGTYVITGTSATLRWSGESNFPTTIYLSGAYQPNAHVIGSVEV